MWPQAKAMRVCDSNSGISFVGRITGRWLGDGCSGGRNS